MLLQILGIPFILCFLCKLYQLDINRRDRIRKKELESSRFTRNQPKFNLLNCQENFQNQNGFSKNQNEFHQDQNGFHQDQNTTILNSKYVLPSQLIIWISSKERKKEQSSFYLCNWEKQKRHSAIFLFKIFSENKRSND